MTKKLPPELLRQLMAPEYPVDVIRIVSMDACPPTGAVLRVQLQSGEEIHLRIPVAAVHTLNALTGYAAIRLPGGTPPKGGKPS